MLNWKNLLTRGIATSIFLGAMASCLYAKAETTAFPVTTPNNVTSYSTCIIFLMYVATITQQPTGTGRDTSYMGPFCEKAGRLVADGLDWPTAMKITVEAANREIFGSQR